MRIALGIEYDGSQFHGWQSQQAGVRTVQSCVEAALARVADHPVSVICAGRTDTGVHASAQVIHFDAHCRRPLRAWVLGCNSYLPDDICVVWAREVAQQFHARFSAYARRYRYVILNRAVRSALQYKQVTWHHYPLDVQRMQAAAPYFLGEQDFSSFRAAGCQSNTPMRNIHELVINRSGDRIHIEIEANAFLHHMVRNIAGVLISIGGGGQPPQWAQQVIKARDRSCAGITAPAAGLCLIAVRYPAEFELPAGVETLGFDVSFQPS
jgi:tRNA pseudouridine38-40 synthase